MHIVMAIQYLRAQVYPVFFLTLKMILKLCVICKISYLQKWHAQPPQIPLGFNLRKPDHTIWLHPITKNQNQHS